MFWQNKNRSCFMSQRDPVGFLLNLTYRSNLADSCPTKLYVLFWELVF